MLPVLPVCAVDATKKIRSAKKIVRPVDVRINQQDAATIETICCIETICNHSLLFCLFVRINQPRPKEGGHNI